ncbi:MAG: peptide ABC transporter substrate-binding protein [Candidatus Baltobacteraceae bacterium]|jgi:peptide/nickel transport system substrate-binding protein
MPRILSRALALGAVALALAGCTKVGGAGSEGLRRNAFTRPHVLRWSDNEDVAGLNPHIVSQANVSWLSELTMAYLARYDRKNEPVPELATEIPTQRNGGISADGKTITFHLRRGVKWSDGKPFDADDVAFSIGVVLNPRNNEIGRDGWNLIAKVDEPDKQTVVLHLKKPYGLYLPTFFGTAGVNPCILPKHILGGLATINDAPYNSLPVGIGPFRYKEWRRGDAIVLEANPYYWRGRPKLDQIVFKIIPDANTVFTQLGSGDLDLWVQVRSTFAERIGKLPGFVVQRRPSTFYDHIDFNLKRAVVADPAVRQALRLATDRRALLQEANHGVGLLSESAVPIASPAYDKRLALVPFDLAKANALLDADGWKRGPDGVRAKNGVRLALEFTLGSGAPDLDTRVELVRAWWKQIGVALSVKHYLPSLYFAPYAEGGILFGGKYDAATFAWGGDVSGDVSAEFECTLIPPNGENNTRYCNRAVDAAMERFKGLYDPAQRQPYADFIQETIFKDAPTIVLDDREDLYAVNADLKNFRPNAVTPFDDFMDVDI